jgi:tRNA (mo5U34)-methyltransferase
VDDTANQQEDLSNLFWWHSIRFDDGRITPGTKKLDLMLEEFRLAYDPIDLRGKSLLDVGAWNGGFSIEAKRRGADRVVALDYVAWRDPSARGREAFDLAVRLSRLPIEAVEINLDEPKLSLRELGTFDIVLFSGVFYHLVDPIAATRELASITKEVLILETHLENTAEQRPMMVFYPGSELNNDVSNWWGPNRTAVEKLLQTFGFRRVDYQDRPDYHRGVFHAYKDSIDGIS